jgi:hypothetical protein
LPQLIGIVECKSGWNISVERIVRARLIRDCIDNDAKADQFRQNFCAVTNQTN